METAVYESEAFTKALEAKKVSIYKALADFQQECPVIYKESTAGSGNFAYKYADLPTILEVINPLLKKNKLGFTQIMTNGGIMTILFHVETGEKLEGFTTVPAVELRGQNPYQSAGSGITYYRRYSLSSMLGIVTDKDTDATGQVKPKKKATVTNEQVEAFNTMLAEGNAKITKAKFIESYDLTDDQVKLLNASK